MSIRARDKKGQFLGRVEDFFGNLIDEYFAEADATVFYYTSGLAVNKNSALVAYGITEVLNENV